MLSKLDIDKIEELEKEQKRLNNNIPFKIKYYNDYLWQIHYSEYTNKYFMLVTTEDLEYSAFFYVLKKQLEQKKDKEKIFVPVSYTDYTNDYLNRMQILDIQNYIWLFTKEWPLVYEVLEKENNLSLQIVGKTYVYDDIQSLYKIKLNNKEEAIKLYKLLKALFILQTELSHHYNIKLLINKNGKLEFTVNGKKIIYEILSSFVKEEYLKAEEKKINIGEEKIEKEKELDKLQKETTKLEKEYLEKEKQIATFLECKKTFLGRVKYFFKYKKVKLSKEKQEQEKKQDVKIVRLNKYNNIKTNYTLEELVEQYKQIDKENLRIKNLKLDIEAITQKKENLKSKVENAQIYIEEIDNHKKSIFDFWKFTNKDMMAELPSGKEDNVIYDNIKNVFNYELDFEDLSNKLDEEQREKLTKEEINSIYLASTDILNDINSIYAYGKISEDRFQKLKEEAKKENDLMYKETFDIFAGMAYDNKTKTLANKKHREEERKKFSILYINETTTLSEYTEFIKGVINNLKSAFKKIKITIDLPIYISGLENLQNIKYIDAYFKSTQAMQEAIYNNTVLNIYKINLKANNNVLAFSNIIYFENNNKTLPFGMNVKEKILLDLEYIKLEEIKKDSINIITYENNEDELSNITIKTIDITEYNTTI